MRSKCATTGQYHFHGLDCVENSESREKSKTRGQRPKSVDPVTMDHRTHARMALFRCTGYPCSTLQMLDYSQRTHWPHPHTVFYPIPRRRFGRFLSGATGLGVWEGSLGCSWNCATGRLSGCAGGVRDANVDLHVEGNGPVALPIDSPYPGRGWQS